MTKQQFELVGCATTPVLRLEASNFRVATSQLNFASSQMLHTHIHQDVRDPCAPSWSAYAARLLWNGEYLS